MVGRETTRSFWNTGGVAAVVAMMEGEVEMDDKSAAEMDSCGLLLPTDTRTGKVSSPDRDDVNWNSGKVAVERLNFVEGFGGCQDWADGSMSKAWHDVHGAEVVHKSKPEKQTS